MKKLFSKLFPFALYLHIFQLERYDSSRAMSWISSHFWQRATQNKKPLVWTQKAKQIKILSRAFSVILLVAVGFLLGPIVGTVLFLVVWMQPYVLILLALLALRPYEIWNRAKTIRDTHKKIKSLKKTKVIGIAGSYGKTSVKDILYHLLSKKYKVLKTPLSYNTIFGIAQVVDLELDDSYDFFLCELGEFRPGDIKEMCDMVMPHYGIITGINDQHLERFGRIENTISTIFELFDCLNTRGEKTIVNFLNPFIKNEVVKRKIENKVISYEGKDSSIVASDISFTDQGSRFVIRGEGNELVIETPLLGSAQINNILGASTLAYHLGVSLQEIQARLKTVPLVPHRFEQKVLQNNLLLIDNSYSSNSDSFREAIAILKGLERKYKILVTPGMVELGAISNRTHEELGRLANEVCTKVILVGTSDRTKSLAHGLAQSKYVFMNDIKNLWQEVERFGFDPQQTAVLLENDLPDNY